MLFYESSASLEISSTSLHFNTEFLPKFAGINYVGAIIHELC